jgi:hypothetical protein
MDETLTVPMEELAGIDADDLRAELGDLPRSMPSRPLLGALPIARVVPQDIHSVMDYAGGLALAIAGNSARAPSARLAGKVLGGAILGTSLMTDYRLSVAKLIPIEVHEALDYLVGAAAIVAPFALGYYRRSRLTALIHIAVGATDILASLFTDYRAVRGRGRNLARR